MSSAFFPFIVLSLPSVCMTFRSAPRCLSGELIQVLYSSGALAVQSLTGEKPCRCAHDCRPNVDRACKISSGVRPRRPECARGAPRACREEAGSRPECAHAGRSAPGVRQKRAGVRPCRPDCAWSGSQFSSRACRRTSGVRPCRPECACVSEEVK